MFVFCSFSVLLYCNEKVICFLDLKGPINKTSFILIRGGGETQGYKYIHFQMVALPEFARSQPPVVQPYY